MFTWCFPINAINKKSKGKYLQSIWNIIKEVTQSQLFNKLKSILLFILFSYLLLFLQVYFCWFTLFLFFIIALSLDWHSSRNRVICNVFELPALLPGSRLSLVIARSLCRLDYTVATFPSGCPERHLSWLHLIPPPLPFRHCWTLLSPASALSSSRSCLLFEHYTLSHAKLILFHMQ